MKRLRRLNDLAYRGNAAVHWAMTIQGRRRGWLDASFHQCFRELLLHSLYRFDCLCPVYCLMPDHIHMLVVGLAPAADQRQMIRHLRHSIGQRLRVAGYDLQKQAFDHVLRTEERNLQSFIAAAEYVMANPVRAGLESEPGRYPYSGAMVPGYPEFNPFEDEFWLRFWRLFESRWRRFASS